MAHESYAKRIVTLFCLVMGLLLQAARVSGDDPVVDTDKGKVRGISEIVNGKTVDIFYSIPYAAPPLGELRFRPTVPNEPWEGVLDTTRQPNACYQVHDTFFGNFSGSMLWNPNTTPSEDCLYLSVWVPRTNPPFENKAVLVWIYGGAFNSGTNTLDVYQASYLAAENDIIVVSMQYRVGALGFLALDTPEAPGNAGIWDQRMALEWVSRNIHHFGGSADNVTLMGESAGADSVGIFLLCDLCRGFFHRAILQSGAPQASHGVLPKDVVKKRSELFAQSVGCDQQSDPEYIVNCLRNLPYTASVIAKESTIINRANAFVPVVDGVLLRQDPAHLLRTGNFKKIPLLLGSNQNEGNYFLIYESDLFKLTQPPALTDEQYSQVIKSLFKYYPHHPFQLNDIAHEAIIFHYKDWVDPENPSSLGSAVDQAFGDYMFVCPVNELARAYSRFNMPVYYYRFNQRWSANPWPEWMGVLHADEIWYIFGHPLNQSYSFTEDEKLFSKKVMTYWTNFAKTGNPNSASGEQSLPEWPTFKYNEQLFINLSAASLTSSHPLGRGPRAQHCAFWDEYLPKLLAETSDISFVEKEWKKQFHEWKTHYIVDWKTQFDNFLSSYQRRLGSCGP